MEVGLGLVPHIADIFQGTHAESFS